jgi:hypothetical protein
MMLEEVEDDASTEEVVEDLEARKKKNMTLKVRLNLTPFMLHTNFFKTLTLQFYVYLVSEKVNKGKEVND